MPVWQGILKEEEVWNVITFLYDHVGKTPKTTEQATRALLIEMRDQLAEQRLFLSYPEKMKQCLPMPLRCNFHRKIPLKPARSTNLLIAMAISIM